MEMDIVQREDIQRKDRSFNRQSFSGDSLICEVLGKNISGSLQVYG